jgi:hypothetical protein
LLLVTGYWMLRKEWRKAQGTRLKVQGRSRHEAQGTTLTLRKFLIVGWAVPTKYR